MVDEELLLAISNVMDVKLSAFGKQVDAKLSAQEKRLMGKIQDLKVEIQDMKVEIRDMKGDIQNLKVYQENVIMPRLQNIEGVYLSTFERYQDAADKMEGAYVDVGLLKDVVRKHSLKLDEHDEQLQKLA